MVFLIIVSLHVGSDESRGLSKNGVYTAEVFFVLCIQILPPQTLRHPRGHCKLISPRRHWISYDLARRWIRRHRKKSTWKFEMLCREFRCYGKEVLTELYEGKVLLDMVAGKYTPIYLFAVVVRMIVAVPRGSDISRRPVCKQAWRHFIRPQAASQEILILVPYAL